MDAGFLGFVRGDYLDCIHVKTRDAGAVRAKAVYLALGISMAGEKEVLGLWLAQTGIGGIPDLAT